MSEIICYLTVFFILVFVLFVIFVICEIIEIKRRIEACGDLRRDQYRTVDDALYDLLLKIGALESHLGVEIVENKFTTKYSVFKKGGPERE